MKKIYTSPVMQQELFETADVITVSQVMVFNKETANATEKLSSVNVSGLFGDNPQ